MRFLKIGLGLGLAGLLTLAAGPAFDGITLHGPGSISRTMTTYSSLPTFLSEETVNHTGGSGAVTFNIKTNSTVYNNGTGLGHWANLNRVHVAGATTIGKNVAGYNQAINGAVDGTAASRELWAGVMEVRDHSGRPSSTGSALIGIEVDVVGDGLDDRNTTGGRNGITILGKQYTTDAVNPFYVGTGLYFGQFDEYTRFKRSIQIANKVSEAGIDFRPMVELSGARAIWMASGHKIALNTGGTAYLWSDDGRVNATKDVMIGAGTDTSALLQLNAASGTDRLIAFQTNGSRRWTTGMTDAGSWVVGRYDTDGNYVSAALDINFTTGKVTTSGGMKVTGTLNVATGTPASASATCTTGDVSWASAYIYVCTATNTWKRAALATW